MYNKTKLPKIDFEKTTPIDILHLFWFYKVKCKGTKDYSSFCPTQSMIDDYNEYIETWIKNYQPKAIIWDKDRTNETDYFKKQLMLGTTFENWVNKEFAKQGVDLGMYSDMSGQFTGENKLGIEIKRDGLFAKTGNIYIEYKERMNKTGRWVNSGILKDDNTKYFIIGTPDKYFIFEKARLQKLFKEAQSKDIKGIKFTQEKKHDTSKGFLIIKGYTTKYALSDNINYLINLYKKVTYGATTRFNKKYYHHDRDCRYIKNKKDTDLKKFNTDEQAIQAGYQKCLNCVHE